MYRHNWHFHCHVVKMQEQKFSEKDSFFAWTFERRRPLWQTVLSFLVPIVTLACCLFPVFPHWCKLGVLYFCLTLLSLIFGLLTCKSCLTVHTMLLMNLLSGSLGYKCGHWTCHPGGISLAKSKEVCNCPWYIACRAFQTGYCWIYNFLLGPDQNLFSVSQLLNPNCSFVHEKGITSCGTFVLGSMKGF
jgi:hypothetical protein